MISQAELVAAPNRVETVLHNAWLAFVMRRLLSLVAILLALGVATFSIVRLIPGDPALAIGGIDANQAQLHAIRHELGLDQAPALQLITYFSNIFHGNLGTSFSTKEPVAQVVRERIGNSVSLAGTSVLLVLLLSIPGGMIAAAFTREGRHPRLELAITVATSVVGSLPEYLMATFLAFLFAVQFQLLPVAGTEGPQSLVLPTLAVALRPAAVLLRIVRVETLNALAQDYVRAARSKRLPARLIYLRHVLPNVATAILTVAGVLFASLIGSTVVVEAVFNRPGLGTSLVNAVLARDYPVVQGAVLVLGVIVVVVNATVDSVLAATDPRSLIRKA